MCQTCPFINLEVEDAGVVLSEALIPGHHSVQQLLVHRQTGDGGEQPAVACQQQIRELWKHLIHEVTQLSQIKATLLQVPVVSISKVSRLRLILIVTAAVKCIPFSGFHPTCLGCTPCCRRFYFLAMSSSRAVSSCTEGTQLTFCTIKNFLLAGIRQKKQLNLLFLSTFSTVSNLLCYFILIFYSSIMNMQAVFAYPTV